MEGGGGEDGMENRRARGMKRDSERKGGSPRDLHLSLCSPTGRAWGSLGGGREGGTGTGNGFYAQSEIYGGRYARAKIILISERKGGKVSQAGCRSWLAGPASGRGYQV